MPKRPRQKKTVTGRVVYYRKPHQFTEKDALRVIRSLLDDKIEDPFAFLSGLLLQIVRIPISTLKYTQGARLYWLNLIKFMIPDFMEGVLESATKYGDEFLITVYNFFGSWLGKLKPSRRLDDLDDIGD